MVSLSPKLNDSALDKKQGDQTQFFPNKGSRKRQMDFILLKFLNCLKMDFIFGVTGIDGSSYRVINSLILQEIFPLSQNLKMLITH